MNRKILYAIIAVIVVIILVIAALELIPSPSTTATMTVSVSSNSASVDQNLTFAAFISGGTPSKVIFNFGDGITGSATHLTGNEYTITHSYSSAGRFLVTANATVNGKHLNNLKSIDEITISPATVNPTVASEITVPTVLTSSQIVAPGSTVTLTASTLEPPTATNWTIGYYIWSFGDKTTSTDYTVYNTSSGSFMVGNVSHLYANEGIYVLTLGVITFNATNYVLSTYTSNGINYTYYPLSDLASILSSSGNYYNNTYVCTLVVNSTAQLVSSTAPITNPHEILVTEIWPGGPYTFDPAIDDEVVGMEVIMNVYETLLQYNGSSATQLFPMIASQIPTIANGGISANFLNYTFPIRSGLKFANGDPLTAWDVYTSYIRTMLFVTSTPGTSGYIITENLLPGGGFAPNATSYQNITSAITVDNTSQTVTFHLLSPNPVFLDYLADPMGASITDYSWLVAHGAGITFTPAGFAAYMNQGNEVDYNNYVRFNAMGSGPYMIKSYIIGQAISYAPNPYYTPIAGIPGYDHAVNDTIYVQYEKDTATALLLAESGQTDIIENLPTYDYPIMSHLQSEGKINITNFPTLCTNWFVFNFNINTTMLSSLGSGYSVPQYYFTNLDVRRAFAYTFNCTNYLNNLLGNKIYGANFGSSCVGVLVPGVPGYMNATQLQQAGAVLQTYNLTIAKQYMEESGEYNVSINIPIEIWGGDPIDFAAAQDWATILSTIDPNIHASAVYMPFNEIIGYMTANQDPMPIYYMAWLPSSSFPSALISPLYGETGTIPMSVGWNPQVLTAAGQISEANNDTQMNNYINEAMSTGNVSLALKYYDMAYVLAINLTFYVYEYQENGFWFYSSALHGFQYEENPMYAPGPDIMYIYLSK